jgi:hypothetical protein
MSEIDSSKFCVLTRAGQAHRAANLDHQERQLPCPACEPKSTPALVIFVAGILAAIAIAFFVPDSSGYILAWPIGLVAIVISICVSPCSWVDSVAAVGRTCLRF